MVDHNEHAVSCATNASTADPARDPSKLPESMSAIMDSTTGGAGSEGLPPGNQHDNLGEFLVPDNNSGADDLSDYIDDSSSDFDVEEDLPIITNHDMNPEGQGLDHPSFYFDPLVQDEFADDELHDFYSPTPSELAFGPSDEPPTAVQIPNLEHFGMPIDPVAFNYITYPNPAAPNFVAPLQNDMMVDTDHTGPFHDNELNENFPSAYMRYAQLHGLIEKSEFDDFSADRIPLPMFTGSHGDSSDPAPDCRDTDKFYPSDDDENAPNDEEDFRPNQNQWLTAGLMSQTQFSGDFPPTGTLDLENAQPLDGNFPENQETMEDMYTALSMQTESMQPSFFIVPMRLVTQALADFQKPPTEDNAFNMAGLSQSLAEIQSDYAKFAFMMLEKSTYNFLMSMKNQLGPGYYPGIVTTDLFSSYPMLTFLSGSNILHLFPENASQIRNFIRALTTPGFSILENQNEPPKMTFVDLQSLEWSQSQVDTQSQPGLPGNAQSPPTVRMPYPILTTDHYLDIHELSEYSYYYVPFHIVIQAFPERPDIAAAILRTPLAPPEGEIYYDANGNGMAAFERNLTVDQFIRQWLVAYRLHPHHHRVKEPVPPISPNAASVVDWERPEKISRPDCGTGLYDIQAIPWNTRLGVNRSTARELRDQWYTSYRNLSYQPHYCSRTLPVTEDYFRPKTMYTRYRASMAHFQLRNLMSVTASNTLQYARQSKVYSITPFYREKNCIIDLSRPTSDRNYYDPVRISTMKAKHGVTVVGGFTGEYAYCGELTDRLTIDGRVTKDPNGITNHIDIIKHRTSGFPRAVISSNDDRIRILDCATNTFTHTHQFAKAINCTDTSPDGRLRVVVGDAPDAWVVDGDTGKPVQTLWGHQDYGFACAWSPDMLHIATSNQDKTVNIWDARQWRILQTLEADVAGYRSLRFSPVGGGPRTLLMCEPADRIAIVNAQSYTTRQVHDFFGEIGGADFSPDGSRIWVANLDVKFGGFMEFDRHQWGQEFGLGHTRRQLIESAGDTYFPDLPNEWLPETALDDDPRCVLGPGERKIRFQKLFNNFQYEMIDPFLG